MQARGKTPGTGEKREQETDMQDQAPMAGPGPVTISEAEMESWPGTPGRERIERARDAREARRSDCIFEPEAGRGRDQAIADIERLEDAGENREFQEWAKRKLAWASSANPAAGPLPAMGEIAAEGNTRTTIGLAVMNERENGTSCSFGRLSRHADWMGMNPALPETKGLEALVIESGEKPGRPGAVIATGPGTAPGDAVSQDFPPGEASTLRDILLWHGAKPSWAPRAREDGERP